jgi:geranylgeranyl reductase family protein
MDAVRNLFDVIVVGSGPAGASCALSLSNSGLKVMVVDKAAFPRDKVCGDALSLDVVNQLAMISPDIAEAFDISSEKMPSAGVRLFSPDLTCIDLPFIHQGQQKNGFVMKRTDFDSLLFKKVKEDTSITVLENCEVLSAEMRGNEIIVSTGKGTFRSTMVVGADGANTVVANLQGRKQVDRHHHSAGLRIYYEGVRSFHHENFIELYFFQEILPGYLWIFPMTHGMANVGIGILSSVIADKGIHLRETMHRLITSHPLLKERFAHAHPLENAKGHGLPLGSKRRAISGERFLLLGDAAGLIDPFTGEGIGNAIRSGRVAAAHIRKCFEHQNFSASFNQQYDLEIFRRMGKEFKISYALQKLCKYPRLFNFVFRRAKGSRYWHDFLIKALSNPDQKKQFSNPLFYYRLFFS